MRARACGVALTTRWAAARCRSARSSALAALASARSHARRPRAELATSELVAPAAGEGLVLLRAESAEDGRLIVAVVESAVVRCLPRVPPKSAMRKLMPVRSGTPSRNTRMASASSSVPTPSLPSRRASASTDSARTERRDLPGERGILAGGASNPGRSISVVVVALRAPSKRDSRWNRCEMQIENLSLPLAHW